MEGGRALIKILVFFVFISFLPVFCYAYDDETTHPALTQEILKFYNSNYSASSFSETEGELIIQGSIDEDIDPRYLNHFYDPVYDRGLTLPVAGAWPSSKEWGTNTDKQKDWQQGNIKEYFSGASDFTWDRAIYDFVWGDRERGLRALGHVLHLLEDATVPDHTRNDPHPPVFDYGSPYEAYARQFTRNSIDTFNLSGAQIPLFNEIQDYFDSLARYSNSNFFSKDSILSNEYRGPEFKFIKKENILGNNYNFSYGAISGDFYRLYRVDRDIDGVETYSLDDPMYLILSDYWRLLSQQAVLHGAGVLNLFREAVAEERRTHALRDKNTSAFSKILNKMLDETKTFFSGAGGADAVAVVSEPQQLIAPVPIPQMHSVSAVPASFSLTVAPVPELIAPSPELISQDADMPPAPVLPVAPPRPLPVDPVPVPLFSIVPGFGGGSVPQQVSPEPAPSTASAGFTAPQLPLVLFEVAECIHSLSPSLCLVTQSEVHLSWSSPDSDDFVLSVDGVLEETHATSSIVVIHEGENLFSLTAKDESGVSSLPVSITVERVASPLIINEVAWTGTEADSTNGQWIELLNNTAQPVDLSNVVLYSENNPEFSLNLFGSIAPRSFYLIEFGSDSVIQNITADLVVESSMKLSTQGEHLVLAQFAPGAATTTLDETFLCNYWCGKGVLSQRTTMERLPGTNRGGDAGSWGTNNQILTAGLDRLGNGISGTPKVRNSLAALVNNGNDVASGDVVLTKEGGPYLISRDTRIEPGATLTFEPGVVLKFASTGSLIVAGRLNALGTILEPVVLTSFDDDEFGGDMNNNGPVQAPRSPTLWRGLAFVQGSDDSRLVNAVVRYGGSAPEFQMANVAIENASPTIDHLVSEFPFRVGLVTNTDAVIQNSIFRSSSTTPFGVGVLVQSGADSNIRIENSSFENNNTGLKISGTHAVIKNNTFVDNGFRALDLALSSGNISGNTGSGNGVISLGNSSPAGNAIFLQGLGSVATSTFGKNQDFAYLLSDFAAVPVGAAAVFEHGAVVKYQNAGLTVSGRLEARGVDGDPVVFTSASDDSAGGDSDANGLTEGRQASRQGIVFLSGSTSALKHTEIRFAPIALQYQGSSPIKLSSISFTDDGTGIDAAPTAPVDLIENIFVGEGVIPSSPPGLF